MTARTTELGVADVVVRSGGELCEGPLWDPRRARLMWVDIPVGRVHALDVATREDSVVADLGQTVGCLGLRASGGYVVATARGVATADAEWAAVTEVAALPGQQPRTRTNDGACDPWGAFWVGTLATDGRAEAGGLYRLDASGAVRQVLDSVTVSNGLDWSPDGSVLYYDDSATRQVAAFDVDPDGTLTGRRTFAEIEVPGAVPDGLTVDAEGFVWVALWDGRRVRRYAPDGRLDREVLLPVDQVSSIAFAGPDLGQLVITTAREHLSDGEVAAHQPLAGSLFLHDPGVRGRPPFAWAG